jgi:hypothetical protein
LAAPSCPLPRTELAALAGADVACMTRARVDAACGLIASFLRRPLWLPGEDDDPHVEELGVYGIAERPSLTAGPWTGWDDVIDGPTSGVVYPAATPVLSVEGDGRSVRDSVSVQVTDPVGALVSVSYRGGWDAETCPWPIRSAVARIAYAMAPVSASEVSTPLVDTIRELAAVGATSARLGDAAVSMQPAKAAPAGASLPGAGSIERLVPGVCAEIDAWRKRDVG